MDSNLWPSDCEPGALPSGPLSISFAGDMNHLRLSFRILLRSGDQLIKITLIAFWVSQTLLSCTRTSIPSSRASFVKTRKSTVCYGSAACFPALRVTFFFRYSIAGVEMEYFLLVDIKTPWNQRFHGVLGAEPEGDRLKTALPGVFALAGRQPRLRITAFTLKRYPRNPYLHRNRK